MKTKSQTRRPAATRTRSTRPVSSLKKISLDIYRKIYLTRSCEETIRKEYTSDDMKTPVHLSNGGEAISASVLAALPRDTTIYGTYRSHALYLAATENTDGFFGELYGKVTGCARGKGGSMHLASPDDRFYLTTAIVGSTVPIAVGHALAHQYRSEKNTVVVFLGDGAMEEGCFWESLNFACLRKLRIIFVCENNKLAIHNPIQNRHGFPSPSSVTKGFYCYSAKANGCRPQEIFNITTRLAKKMDAHPKPVFLELEYHRFLEHVGINEDFKVGYRRTLSAAELLKNDPVLHSEKWAKKCGATPEEISRIQKTADQKIAKSIENARAAAFPPPEELYEHVYR